MRSMPSFVLVDLLLRHPFDSLARAPRINVPMLALIAGSDSVVPPAHAQALVKAWRGPVTSVIFERAGHGSISREERYWPAVREFLNRPASSRPPEL